MPELKVECDCGQRYKFDVEPVNGRMPFTVNCPTCGVDGTPKANALLQQIAPAPAASPIHLIELPPIGTASSAPAPVVSSTIAPPGAPAMAPVAATTAPAPVGPPKLRVSGLAPVSAPSAGGGAPPSIAPPPPIGAPIAPMAPIARGGPMRVAVGATATEDPDKPKPNFWMGIVGGLSGALVGAVVFFFLFKLTGMRFHRLAEIGSIGVGYLAGAGAAWLGKGEGSKELGGITAIFALAGIIAAEYFTAMTWYSTETSNFGGSLYAMNVKQAKEVVQQIPTGSDNEIRVYLVKQAVDDGDDNASNSVSAADVNEFRTNELVEFQGLASGQITEHQYYQKNGIDEAAMKKAEGRAETIFAGVNFLLFLNKTNILMIIAAVGLAFRIPSNA